MERKNDKQTEPQPPKRSLLPGEMGDCVDRVLLPGEDLVLEVAAYRGQALVLTDIGLLLIVGGVLVGLKPHEQHVTRIMIDDIVDIKFIPEKLGCFSPFIGPPMVQVQVTPRDRNDHDPKWDTVMVGFKMLGEAVQLVNMIKFEQGKRQGQQG